MKFIVESEIELVRRIRRELEGKLEPGFKVGLIGDLGAGKTALVRGLLSVIGVSDPVTSPTFTLRKIYETKQLKIQHIDLYRHEKNHPSPEIEEWLLDDDYLTFVEWPDNLKTDEVAYNLRIIIKSLGKTSRAVELIWS